MNKTQKRIKFVLDNRAAIEAARVDTKSGSQHNARFNPGMSDGGWGWWAKALALAGVDPQKMNYWSGSAPMPSTAINGGIAQWIEKNAPEELK